MLAEGELPSLAAVGTSITDFSYTVVYEPMQNGAYFLGELRKFVHVSPQRFDKIITDTNVRCRVRPFQREALELCAVAPMGVHCLVTALFCLLACVLPA